MRAESVLLAVLLGVGCAGQNGEVGANGAGGASGAEGADYAMVGDVAASVEVKVQPDAVRLLLHVTNVGDRPLEFTFPSSQRYDFVVETMAGERVWQWSSDMMFAQVISEASLEPGETWAFDATWEPGDRTGVFRVIGEVTASERDVRQSTTFELP
jgi:hypothetical protein